MTTAQPSPRLETGSESPPAQVLDPLEHLPGLLPGLVALREQLRALPLFQAAARRERLRLLESAEAESSPEAASKLLATARALAYLGSARFDSHIQAEVADQFSGLGGEDLRRLVEGSPGKQDSGQRALDSSPREPRSIPDIMAFDSDGGVVLPFQLGPRGQTPVGDDE
jgi:hypothetical protein